MFKTRYSTLQFAIVYFINLHLAQGIIIVPKLVSRTGLLLSTLLLVCIAGVNFITATHVLEAMGIANACYRLETRRESVTKELDVSRQLLACKLIELYIALAN